MQQKGTLLLGLRTDVLYNCGIIINCTHVANGVGWYYSYDYSWGFVQDSDSVYRSSCDTGKNFANFNTQGTTDPGYRLCSYTGSTYGGYRCGSNVELNTDQTFRRVIYHVD